ncbi:MAG: hypothetical protein H6835_10785 [Planctomycetes bacterium]|nr:hypothetical protein [Planctomycetota bacterium]
MRRLRHFVAALSAAFFAACAAPLQLPEGFVELEDAGYGYRAVTSDDARLWLRELRDPTEGEIEFWAEALQRDLVEERGYELVASGDLQDASGAGGRWLEATSNVRGQRIDYLVALWCRKRSWWLGGGEDLLVAEFAAGAEVYARRLAQVKAALSTVRW